MKTILKNMGLEIIYGIVFTLTVLGLLSLLHFDCIGRICYIVLPKVL